MKILLAATIPFSILALSCGGDSTATGPSSPVISGTTGAGGSQDTSGGSGGSLVSGGTGGDGASGSTGGTGVTGGAGDSTGIGGSTSGAGGSGGGGVSPEAGTSKPDASPMAPDSSVPKGNSAGCGKPPPQGDTATKYALHVVKLTGLDPVYLTGGMYADSSGPYDLSNRPYGVKLPKNYDPTKSYPVTFGAGGCGGNASDFAKNPGGGLQPDNSGSTIQVGLQYINTCFNDGGPAIGDRDDTPEAPYFTAVLAEVEAMFCVDRSKVFMTGFSSGGWESFTLGCTAANVIRGIGTDEGGMRAHRPACTGPVAAMLVAGEQDMVNPIGPLDPSSGTYKALGSPGSAPGRDDILKRDGCVGTATKQWDPAYPACLQYTGCPAAYPVVWCQLPGAGHNDSTYNNVQYSPGGMWKLFSALPSP